MTARMAIIWLAVAAAVSPAIKPVANAAPATYYVDASRNGTSCVIWLDACPDLQTALNLADPGDQIWVANGYYIPGMTAGSTFTIENQVSIYGGFAGNETSLGQRDIMANLTVLSGEFGDPTNPVDDDSIDNVAHVVTIPSSVQVGTVIDGLTIWGGIAGLDAGNKRGGGILNSGSPLLRNVTLFWNDALDGGGAIYSSSGWLQLKESLVSNNHSNRGGGINVACCDLTIENVTFLGNLAPPRIVGDTTTSGSGGAIFSSTSGTVLVKNATFLGNSVDNQAFFDGAGSGFSLAMEGIGSGQIYNSILYNREVGANAELTKGASNTLSVSHSLVHNPCGAGITCSDAVSGQDPDLGPLADNGGPTKSVAVGAAAIPNGDPKFAIDRGDPATCTAIDQRGFPRPFDADAFPGTSCDLGALEYVPLDLEFSAASSSGPESSAAAAMNVHLQNAFIDSVSVNYAVTGGTASSPADYTLAAGTLVFPAGTVDRAITATVVNDQIDEPNETLTVTLSTPAIATLGSGTTHTRTIVDDEPTPSVEFVTVAGQGSEATSKPNVSVRLSGQSASTVTVKYSVIGGTADQPADFSLADGTLSIPPLALAGKVPLSVVDEFEVEPNETVAIGLDEPVNALLGGHDAFTYTIKNNDVGTCEGEKATLAGTGGADVIDGTAARDVIVARGGDDKVNGRGGNDLICAGPGDDAVSAGGGNDEVLGEKGDDSINGQGGKDALDGGEDADFLKGGTGDDTLTGGPGKDDLRGEGGADDLSGGGGAGDRCDGGPGIDKPTAGKGCEVTAGVP